MENKRITLETAKLAKTKGFKVFVYGVFTEYLIDQKDPEYPEGGGSFSMTKGEVEFSNNYFKNNSETDYSCDSYVMYAAPKRDELQDWVRTEHEIYIEIYCNASGWGWILTKLNGTTIKEIEDDIFFPEYEDALEEGLKQALNII